MDERESRELAEKVLGAWNVQDVEAVLDCYTEDCVYRDPNTGGPLEGRESFGRYLARLFNQWHMHWSLREFFPFDDGRGGAFLWRATLTPAGGGSTTTVEGMDLVLLRGRRLCRNEVYFDRLPLLSRTGRA